VIHIHELHGYYVNYFQVINFISKKNIPLVWTLHSEFDFTGKCGYSYSCIKWQKECNFCPQVDVYPKSLYFDFSKYLFRKKKNVFSNLQKVIFVPVSNWLDNKKKLSFLKDFNSTIVYNGIDTIKTFYPKYKNNHYEAIKSNGEFIVLSVAPDIFSDRKGGKTILDIAERLKHLPIKFVLVGTDESQTSKQENVIYISLIKDQKRLSEVYSISDLFLLTSKFETFSLTTIESLACGVPVIGYDCGGATEIAPPPFGNFIPYGDIEGLTQLISECYSKKFSLPSKDECVNFIKKNYSSNKMFNKYFSIYNNIANN
jgi:glycosyltransferase involved in cell wall biosynthesis